VLLLTSSPLSSTWVTLLVSSVFPFIGTRIGQGD
jgi:hypothetical protein